MRYFGCHVSSAKGLENAIKNGRLLGVNTIQIHPSAPQQWNRKPFAPGVEDRFCEERKESGIRKVFLHAVYLINLATPDAEHFANSKRSLLFYLELLARIGGDGVIVHVGSMKNQPSEEAALRRAASGINWLMKRFSGKGRLLLEVTAGGGAAIGGRVEQLARLHEYLEEPEKVGFALDTQHLWASGYDLRNDLDAVVKDIVRCFGVRKIGAIHVNDSKTALGSRHDRHENIGRGAIGSKALAAFVNHPRLRRIPMILETPGLADLATARREVQALKRLLDD